MKYRTEEFLADYDNYKFGYTHWGIPESDQDIETLYEQGFLPYSGTERAHPCYYLCRSIRVDASEFVLSSENRRVLRKVAEVGIVPERIEYLAHEVLGNDRLKQFFLDYFNKHHGQGVMNCERLEAILRYSQHVKVVGYLFKGDYIGAIITQELRGGVHYWFAAYSDNDTHLSLGMWLMVTFIKDYTAQNTEKVIYLGTGYGSKALYKTNIEQIEYFDGNTWKKDLKTLKNLLRGT
jgi:arginyl-tRNA--protein-N-Asp/Glu arginylyltransferase